MRALPLPDPLAEPRLYDRLTRDYLVWDAYTAGQRRVDLHPIVLSEELHRSAVETAERVARVVGRAAARAHVDGEERARYALHEDVLRLARASHLAGDDAALVRVDLLMADDGDGACWQACEVNADCPGGHNEAMGLPRLAREAGFTGGSDPTRVLDALVRRLAHMANGAAGEPGAVALLYATAYAEDLQVCALIQRALERHGLTALLASPTAPRMRDGHLQVRGQIVRALYRFFPAEYMEALPNLGDICAAIESGGSTGVRSISSFAHIFAQSKLAFARAFACDGHDGGELLGSIPDTFDLREVERDSLVSERVSWVMKKDLGRVGDEVFVGPLVPPREWVGLVDAVIAGIAERDERWIAQRFVRQRPISTPWGDRYLTLGAYVLDGQFTGYFARVTAESHVSHGALCLPVFTVRR